MADVAGGNVSIGTELEGGTSEVVDSGISTVDVLGSTVVEVVVSGTVVVAGSVTGTVSGGTVEEEVVVGGVDSVVNAHSGTMLQS
jgi:hypothetical protein